MHKVLSNCTQLLVYNDSPDIEITFISARAGHMVHHSSPDMNLSTALRQGITEPIVSVLSVDAKANYETSFRGMLCFIIEFNLFVHIIFLPKGSIT